MSFKQGKIKLFILFITFIASNLLLVGIVMVNFFSIYQSHASESGNYHECNLSQKPKCIGTKIYQCMNNCDSDIYRDWCPVDDCSLSGRECEDGKCAGIAAGDCADGSLNNHCSEQSGSPWYCTNGELVENCELCGCKNNWECITGTSCSPPSCDSSCAGAIGCQLEGIEHSRQIAGACCVVGQSCYECEDGYKWDGSNCINACADTCESLGYECGRQEICGQDMDCGECTNGEVCCGNECQVPVCTENNECADESQCTVDVCNSIGNCSYTCVNTTITKCQDNDGCCPDGCSYNNDSDCEKDELSPVIKSFRVENLNSEEISISWEVEDNIALASVEIWRTMDDGGQADAGAWELVEQKDASGISNAGEYIDKPEPFSYWYGIHALDRDGNIGTEDNIIKISSGIIALCGNGICESGEDCQNCAGDCGACLDICGDGLCDQLCDESSINCPQDCPAGCGDGHCETTTANECSNCPSDCSHVECCGNDVCDSGIGEDDSNCSDDCQGGNCDLPFYLPCTFSSGLLFQALAFPGCEHECNLSDPDYCIGDIIFTCQNNCDSDYYRDWCAVADCSARGQICFEGACQYDCQDNDNDGYDTCDPVQPGDTDGRYADCNDANGSIHPNAAEICGNQIDEDCNGFDQNCTSTIKPIAHTDVVPYQRIKYNTTFNFGVVAFSKPGIDRVEFAISGAGYTGQTKRSTEMTLNTRVASAEYNGVWEYWVPIHASEFRANGEITVTPTVYDNQGNTRNLGPTVLIVEGASAYTPNYAYVNPATGNDSSASANSQSRFQTIGAAVAAAQAANNGNSSGNIIYLDEGTYSIAGLNANAVGEWFTITKAPNANKENVVINPGRPGFVSHLKFDSVTLRSTGQNQFIIHDWQNGDCDYLWTNSCRIIGAGRWIPDSNPIHWNEQNVTNTAKRWSTDDYTYDVAYGYHCTTLIRGAVVSTVGDDVFENFKCVINSKSDNLNNGQTRWHSDVLQTYQRVSVGDYAHIPNENRLAYNIYATDNHVQSFMRETLESSDPNYGNSEINKARNNAFVNVFIEMREPPGYESSGCVWNAGLSYTNADDHLLMWHCTFPRAGQGLSFSHDGATNSSIVGNIWWQQNFGDENYSDTDILYNHYMYYYGGPQCTPSACNIEKNQICPSSNADAIDTGINTMTTGGDVIDLDLESSTFGYPTDPELIDRQFNSLGGSLGILDVKCDALGNPRDSNPDIGALEYNSDPGTCTDNDNDGYGICPNCNQANGCRFDGNDCSDSNQYMFPGNPENCDLLDNNCNGQTDEGCDDDNDGYCDNAMQLYINNSMCLNTQFVNNGMNGNDCNDNNTSIHPNAAEICGNQIDDDCDGEADEGCGDPETCYTSNSAFSNVSVDTQANSFEVAFNMTPSGSNIDAVAAFSEPAADSWDDLAITIRLNANGYIDVRNGSIYTSDMRLRYTSGVKYFVSMAVNMANKTYDVYVTPQGGSEVLLADDYAFRSGQEGVTAINYLTYIADEGSHEICDIEFSSDPGTCTDSDNDGYGAPGSTGCIHAEVDCNDSNNSIHPNATEICGNNIDEDCDGSDLACADPAPPQITNFTVLPANTTNSVTASYGVTDNLALERVELWRTTDLSGAPNSSNWQQVQTRDISGMTASGSWIDTPANGTFWYGLHVVDAAGNLQTEDSPIRIVKSGTSTIKPIAHIDVVPYQRIKYNTTFNFGVVAFSKPGIDRVEFAISGQGYSGETKESTEMTLNTRVASAEYSGVWEYWVPISASEFNGNGEITVTPTVYDNQGNIRLLDPVVMIVEGLSSYTHNYAYVNSVSGNDSSASANSQSRFRTIQAAVNAAQTANGGNSSGNIIYLDEGTYSIAGLNASTPNEWLTITKSPNANKENVLINRGSSAGSFQNISLLKIDSVTLQPTGYNTYVIEKTRIPAGMFLWTNECRRIGYGSRFGATYTPYDRYQNMPIVMNNYSLTDTQKYYSTDDYTYNATRAYHHDNFVRGPVVESTGEDVFHNCLCVINARVNDVTNGPSWSHVDVFQWYRYSLERKPVSNRLIYNLYATDCHYQIFNLESEVDDPHDNAIINVFVELREPPDLNERESTLGDAACPYGAGNYLSNAYNSNHLLVWHCTFPRGMIGWGFTDEGNTTDTSIVGNVFRQAGYNDKNYSDTDILYNHYMYYYGGPACTPSQCQAAHNYPCPHWHVEALDTGNNTVTTGGDVIDLSDPNSSTFGYPTSPDLINRPFVNLNDSPGILDVKCDALGNPRDSRPDIGALEYNSNTNICSDNDNDGYGTAGSTGCTHSGVDCNDNEYYANPGIDYDTCDTVDNNCDGQTDEGCDDDNDGYCNSEKTIYRNNSMCPNTAYIDGRHGDDCDDNNTNINPRASEICDNGDDDDCDGAVDQTDGDCSSCNENTICEPGENHVSCPSDCVLDARIRIAAEKDQFITNETIYLTQEEELADLLSEIDIPAALEPEFNALSDAEKLEVLNNFNNTKKLAEQKKVLWQPELNAISLLPDAEKRKLLGLAPPTREEALAEQELLSKRELALGGELAFTTNDFPDEFDWRDAHGENYLSPIRNQSSCGSCWAFAGIGSLEGTAKALYNNPDMSINLSEQDLVSCYLGDGCAGAYTSQIGIMFSSYFIGTGVPTETCFPYTATNNNCANKCSNWEDAKWTTEGYVAVEKNISAIKKALVEYGPVVAGMVVYSDFSSYSGGIYRQLSTTRSGYHAVVIVGYGKYDGQDYWIVRNSWGTGWGEDGYFRIFAGEAGIDSRYLYVAKNPTSSTAPDVRCVDIDDDGYCNWGIGEKPSSGCPACSNELMDCDDSDPDIYLGCGVIDTEVGVISIDSSPTGADVYYWDNNESDFIYQGQTPISTIIETGLRQVKLSLDGYLDANFSVQIAKDQAIEKFITMDETRPISKIVNLGTDSLSGNLNISIDQDQSGLWRNYSSVISNYPLSLEPMEEEMLAGLFNPRNINLSAPGRYRIVSELRDESGVVYNTPSGELSHSWEIDVEAEECVENWVCTGWSTCDKDNIRSRSCSDNNDCGTEINKPLEEGFCVNLIIYGPLDNAKLVKGSLSSGLGYGAYFSMYARGGVEPIQYNWHSNHEGDFLTTYSDFVDIEDWALGSHVITASAIDSLSSAKEKVFNIEILPEGSFAAEFTNNITRFTNQAERHSPQVYGRIYGGYEPFDYTLSSDKYGVIKIGSTTFTSFWEYMDFSSWELGSDILNIEITDLYGNTAEDSMEIEIIEFFIDDYLYPEDGEIFEESERIYFNCQIHGGSAPYDFTFSSDIDGLFHQELDTIDEYDYFDYRDLSLGMHTITASVEDSSGVITSKEFRIQIVPREPLTALISAPHDNSTYELGQYVQFMGEAAGGMMWYHDSRYYDFEWSSNLDGVLDGEISEFTDQTSLNINTLSIGDHVISLRVIDELGDYGIDTIKVHIVSPQYGLESQILSPIQNSSFYRFDDLIHFNAETTGGAAPYSYSWISDIDGELSRGLSFYQNDLSVGSHEITLATEDAAGYFASSTININIAPGQINENIKNIAAYGEKEAFLVSDANWRDVLSLVPVASWRSGGNNYNYSSLIYHSEGSAFDADAIIDYLQQYEPDHLTTVGSLPQDLQNLLSASPSVGAGLDAGQMNNINASQYFSYWDSFGTIVAVDYNGYKAGLAAGAFAAFMNCPIIFIDENNLSGYEGVLQDKLVYVVDSLDSAVDSYINANANSVEYYSITDLQALYKELTNSDKVIFVNPNDLSIAETASYYPKKSGSISSIYSKMSLAAPFLAAAKREVIAFTELNDTGTNSGCGADADITNNINQADADAKAAIEDIFDRELNYFTIVASHRAIPDSQYEDCYGSWHFREVADAEYANIEFSDYDEEDPSVGRITGITVSDASAYIARSINYDYLLEKMHGNNFGSLSIGSHCDEFSGAHCIRAKTIRDNVAGAGYNASCYTSLTYENCTRSTTPGSSLYQSSNYITFLDHGGPYIWSSVLTDTSIPTMYTPVVLASACLTNNFWQYTPRNIGAHMIRNGAIGYVGANGVTWSSTFLIAPQAIETLSHDPVNATLGEMFNDVYNSCSQCNDYSLLGDPTVKPKFKYINWP